MRENSTDTEVRGRRRWGGPSGLAAALLAGLVMLGCGGGASGGGAAKSDFLLGFDTDLSGVLGQYGQPIYDGFQAYVKYANAKGGANGHKVKVTSLDSRSTSDGGVLDYQQLAGQNVLGVFGNIGSGALTAVAPQTSIKKIPYVTATTASGLFSPVRPYLFSADLPHAFSAAIQVQFAADLAKKDGVASPKVALIYLNIASGDAFRQAAEQAVTARGWRIVNSQAVANTATDFSSTALTVAQAKPDYVIAMVAEQNVLAVVQALGRNSVTAPFINFYAASSETVFSTLKSPGYYAVRSYLPPADPAAATVSAQLKATGAKADDDALPYATLGWTEGILAFDALRRCGDSCTAERLRDALEMSSLDTKGLSGLLKGSADDHQLVHYGRVYHWDSSKSATAAVTDWIKS